MTEACLPSGRYAVALVGGDLGAIVPILGYTALRAGLIAAGIWLLGARKHLVRNSVAGALGVEAYVLTWAAIQKRGQS